MGQGSSKTKSPQKAPVEEESPKRSHSRTDSYIRVQVANDTPPVSRARVESSASSTKNSPVESNPPPKESISSAPSVYEGPPTLEYVMDTPPPFLGFDILDL